MRSAVTCLNAINERDLCERAARRTDSNLPAISFLVDHVVVVESAVILEGRILVLHVVEVDLQLWIARRKIDTTLPHHVNMIRIDRRHTEALEVRLKVDLGEPLLPG